MNEFVQQLQEEEDTMQGKYLTFILGKETYGMEIKYVTEIIGMQHITVVPDLPEYVKGIINLRGKIIPVIDVRMKFNKESIEYNDRTCIIVVDIMNISVGLIVDKVAEVISIADEDIVLPPDSKTGFTNKFVNGIGKVGNEIKLLIDCQRVLNCDAINSFAEEL